MAPLTPLDASPPAPSFLAAPSSPKYRNITQNDATQNEAAVTQSTTKMTITRGVQLCRDTDDDDDDDDGNDDDDDHDDDYDKDNDNDTHTIER